jgi:hypothetical protein
MDNDKHRGHNNGGHYKSFLLRLWQPESAEGDATGDGAWFASLEATFTHERHNFPSLASLFAHIEEQTRDMSACDE